MIGTEEETMQDQTRGKGASFDAVECGMLEAAVTCAKSAQQLRAASGKGPPMSPAQDAVLDELRSKCARGAGL